MVLDSQGFDVRWEDATWSRNRVFERLYYATVNALTQVGVLVRDTSG